MTGNSTMIDRKDVTLDLGAVRLQGLLRIPPAARSAVLFAHGTGSDRFSERNTHVATVLEEAGIGSLLLNLLQEDEAAHGPVASDMEQLAGRLEAATRWLQEDPESRQLPLGYFGASTGAAVALIAAARQPESVLAVVSRGGRTDLACGYLQRVQAPTLLIAGSNDLSVLQINRECESRFTCPTQLDVIEGAGHLFEEPGTLDEMAHRASEWFQQFLPATDSS